MDDVVGDDGLLLVLAVEVEGGLEGEVVDGDDDDIFCCCINVLGKEESKIWLLTV
jgi:hypothetical protein